MNKKLFIIAVGVLSILVSPATVLAWGPDRPTYTNEVPAASATFNSITNNAAVGDEREFVRIREKKEGEKYTANTDDSGFLIEPGKAYEVYIYYHNDAASNTNATGEGIATDVRVNTHFTSKITPSSPGYVNAKIMSADANPKDVWDELKLISNEDVTLKFIANSAVIHNSWATNGMILNAENLFSDNGAYIGVDSLNGVVFGCAEYSGYITYDLVSDDKPETPSELPNTGPLEIVLAIIIIASIGGTGWYFLRARKAVKKANNSIINGNEDNTQNQIEDQQDDNKHVQ